MAGREQTQGAGQQQPGGVAVGQNQGPGGPVSKTGGGQQGQTGGQQQDPAYAGPGTGRTGNNDPYNNGPRGTAGPPAPGQSKEPSSYL